MIDDEQLSAGYLTRLVGRVVLKSCLTKVLLASRKRGTLSSRQAQTFTKNQGYVQILWRFAENMSTMRTEASRFLLVCRKRGDSTLGSVATT